MAKGIVRRIDELGRIVIPMEYRKTFSIQERDPLGMFVEDGIIHLIKAGPDFKGMVRKLDELGRYTLPIETRRSLGFQIGQRMDIYVDEFNDAICIRKEGCFICGSPDKLHEIEGLLICDKHAQMIADKVRGGIAYELLLYLSRLWGSIRSRREM